VKLAFKIFLAVIAAIVGLGIVAALLAPADVRTPGASTVAAATAAPDEPCSVEGTAEQQRQMAPWCEGGVFTNVSVKNDAAAMVFMMTLSRKGLTGWNADHTRLLDAFGETVDRVARVAPGGVAVALFDPSGQMVGGCTREVRAPRTTCRAVR
jgi:hypothetical protein